MTEVFNKILGVLDVHERRASVVVEWPALEKLLKEHAHRLLSAEGSTVPGAEYSFEVKIERQTEGSPSYIVDKWSAMVRVVMTYPEKRQEDFTE